MPLTILQSDHEVPEGTWYLQRVGAGEPMVIPFIEKNTVIGSETLHRKAKHVSEQHATFKLIEEENVVLVVDKNTQYGTYINHHILPTVGQILSRNSLVCLGCKYLKSAKYYGFVVQYKDETSGPTSDSDCSVNSGDSCEIIFTNVVKSPNEVADRKRKHNLHEETTQRSDSTNMNLNRIEQHSSARNEQSNLQRTSHGKSILLYKPSKPKQTVCPVPNVNLYIRASSQKVVPESSTRSAEQPNAVTQEKFPYAETLRPRHTSGTLLLSLDAVAELQNPDRRPKKSRSEGKISMKKILKSNNNRIRIPGGGQDCKMK